MLAWLTFVEATIALAEHQSSASAVAIIGAVTGVAALLWNIGRSMTERARLRIAYYVYNDESDTSVRAVAAISITNAGKLPAYVSRVGVTADVPWLGRWPVIRAASFRTMNRWWFKLLWRDKHELHTLRIYPQPDLRGRIECGEMKAAELYEQSGAVMNNARVRHTIAREHPWLVVETGLRRYFTRVVDNSDG
jgi:hypothetical protein